MNIAMFYPDCKIGRRELGMALSNLGVKMIAMTMDIRVRRGEAFEAVIKSYKLSVEDEAKVREYVLG